MVLNLRNLTDKPEPRRDGHKPLDSFTCHGLVFEHHTLLDVKRHTSGYHDRVSGLNPQSNNLKYRQGYVEALLDEFFVNDEQQRHNR